MAEALMISSAALAMMSRYGLGCGRHDIGGTAVEETVAHVPAQIAIGDDAF